MILIGILCPFSPVFAEALGCKKSLQESALGFLQLRAKLAVVAARCPSSNTPVDPLAFRRWLDQERYWTLNSEAMAGDHLIKKDAVINARSKSLGEQFYQKLLLEQSHALEAQGLSRYCEIHRSEYLRITALSGADLKQELLSCDSVAPKPIAKSALEVSPTRVSKSTTPNKVAAEKSLCPLSPPAERLAEWLAFVDIFGRTCGDYFSSEYSVSNLSQSFRAEFGQGRPEAFLALEHAARMRVEKELVELAPFKFCYLREREFLRLTKTELASVRSHLAASSCGNDGREPAYSSR